MSRRFEAVQGVVYDTEQDRVTHDVNRTYPHVRESDRIKLAEGCARRLNNNERNMYELDNMVRGNTGVL